MKFKNKVVIVTGASSGIGKACAEAFAKEGAKVALAARRLPELQALECQIVKQKGIAASFRCDMKSAADIKKLVSGVEKQFGPCDVLVNNAGISKVEPFVKSSTEDVDDILGTNVRGLMILTRRVLPSMIKRKTGAIINISSIAGKAGLKDLVIYSASKFAVSGFSQALLEEVREFNVKVSNICPGMVNTEIHGSRFREAAGDMIQPEDVARAVLLAASPSETCTISEMLIRPRRPL